MQFLKSHMDMNPLLSGSLVKDELPQKQHYFHYTEYPHSERQGIKSFRCYHKDRHLDAIVMINHNNLQLYILIGSTLVYLESHEFMCDITFVEIIPVKGNISDLFFIADAKGRYLFWSIEMGDLSANNLIKDQSQISTDNFYAKMDTDGDNYKNQFHGISSSFNALDTEATIFFSLPHHKIVLLSVRVRKGKTLAFIKPPQLITLPNMEIKHIGFIKSRQSPLLLGIIEQRQERTYLHISSFAQQANQPLEHLQTIQKNNLTSFCTHDNQIVTVTNSELTIYEFSCKKSGVKILLNAQTICNFSVMESGSVSLLEEGKYIYVGQNDSQMIVFGKKNYKSYGSFMLNNDTCIELSSHGKMVDGGYLIGVVDQGNTVEFISLFEDHWKSVRSVSVAGFFFSLQDLENRKQCLAVTRISDNIHQVGILSKKTGCILEKQAKLPSPIVQIFSLSNGQAIIVCTPDSNTVLFYDKQLQSFVNGFQLPSGLIVMVAGKYVATESRVYQIDLADCRANQILYEKTGIVSAQYDGSNYIGFQCKEFTYKFLNVTTNQIDRMRKNCQEEYIWRFHGPELLLTGKLDQPGSLSVIPVFGQMKSINLQIQDIISDFRSKGELIFVSFIRNINVYSLNSQSVVYCMQTSSQCLKILNCGPKVLIYSSIQSHLISIEQNISSRAIEFDGFKDTIQCIFLEKQQKVIALHDDSRLSMYALPPLKSEKETNFRILSIDICNQTKSAPPFTTSQAEKVYIVVPYEIMIRHRHSAELLKKQSHCLKEINCIEKLDYGLLVIGIDDIDHGQMFLFDYQSLEILCTENIDKKTPTAIKSIAPNMFFMRQENYLTLYEITPIMKIKEKFSHKTNLCGYTLAVCKKSKLMVITDPLRYVAAYNYQTDRLVSLCRHHNMNTVIDIQFLENSSVVVGDNAGFLSILEFNLSADDVSATLMTEVGSLKLGSQVMILQKAGNGVVYCTLSGAIGRVRCITKEEFKKLKKVERDMIEQFKLRQNSFSYEGWRNRKDLDDKLVDGFLVRKYIQKASQTTGNNSLQQIKELYGRLTETNVNEIAIEEKNI